MLRAAPYAAAVIRRYATRAAPARAALRVMFYAGYA